MNICCMAAYVSTAGNDICLCYHSLPEKTSVVYSDVSCRKTIQVAVLIGLLAGRHNQWLSRLRDEGCSSTASHHDAHVR